jgi:aldehyde:ferredoxin oxidoreductase
MYGWMGKVLRVDLTNGRITKEPLEEELAHKYVGGRGFTIKYLYDELEPGIDPLSAENKIIFASGPACGTLLPGSQRWTVSAKSPMTGLIGDANSGGSFGTGLKYAGYDMVIIEGKSERPLYLLIDGDDVQLRDAAHFWYMTTNETERAIKREVGDPDIHIASIGTAGDNLVRYACIESDNRTAGRTGMGAVMGSKKLKAIAARGSKGVKIASLERVEKVSNEIYNNWRDNVAGLRSCHEEGQPAVAAKFHSQLGILPTRNFREGVYEPFDSVPQQLKEEIWLKPRSCFSCPVACDHEYIISKGPYAGTFGNSLYGPSYWYTSIIANPDPVFMCKLTAISDQYGIDAADFAGVIGWLMECYQLGIITAEDLGGVKMEWGDAEAILEVMEMIVHRRGIGDLLAEGAKKASEVIGKGSENYVMHVKGICLDSRDPRGSKGWALGYAVSSRGAEHCRHFDPDFVTGRNPEMTWMRAEFDWFKGTDRMVEEGKGKTHKWFEDVRGFQHALQNCLFAFESKDIVWTEVLAEMFNAVTGLDIGASEVLAVGERVTNLERAFNIREGLTRKDDSLPTRFLKEPMTEGDSKGEVVNLDFMLDEYYEARGWDKGNGFPMRQKLEQLGLAKVADELYSLGKLA